ncbi:MAG: Imm21 family immunity protein [Thiobacillus sp.]
MSTPTPFKWIYSGGGPYILATSSSAHAWLGTQELSAGDRSRYENDYQRACESKDYVSVIPGKSHEILVIGEPDETAWLSRAPDDILLVKWVGADSDQQVWEALQCLDFESFETLPIRFSVFEPKLFLFDSAWQLADIGDNYLELTLEPGCYGLSVLLNYKPDDRLWLDLIRLKRFAALDAQ